MRTDQFYVFSRFGRKHFMFNDEKKATSFFDKFVGEAMLMKGAIEISKKNTITDIPTLIHAGIFFQHGILRDGNNTIDERFLMCPDQKTIDDYKEIINNFKSGYGVFLFGKSGIGKTTMIRFLQTASIGGYIDGGEFENVKVYDIIKTFKTESYGVIKKYKLDDESNCNICIDDLGRDNGSKVYYGDRVNVLSEIIESRYDSFIERGLITHFTSNFSKEELQQMYDTTGEPVIWGRICEMTIFKILTGDNYRLNIEEDSE